MQLYMFGAVRFSVAPHYRWPLLHKSWVRLSSSRGSRKPLVSDTLWILKASLAIVSLFDWRNSSKRYRRHTHRTAYFHIVYILQWVHVQVRVELKPRLMRSVAENSIHVFPKRSYDGLLEFLSFDVGLCIMNNRHPDDEDYKTFQNKLCSIFSQ